MATYAELYDLRSNAALKNRVAIAVMVKAQALLAGASPTAAQVAWAANAIRDPDGKASQLYPYVLAANAAATVAQINAATDAAIQSSVNAAADALIAGNIT